MKAVGMIPARWASTRFEGKILAEITGKPMIQHVWERCKQSKKLDEVMIACDDDRIRKTAQKFGAFVVMTAKDHTSGTDRIAEAVRQIKADIVINIQGDEPLIHHSMIDDLVQTLEKNKDCPMATVVKEMGSEDLSNPNVVKVVRNKEGYALYFSRSAIPFNRKGSKIKYYKHIGIYGYRKHFLSTFQTLPKSLLEEAEQLEQLRVLEAGYKIKTVETRYKTIGVDTPADLKRVEEILSK